MYKTNIKINRSSNFKKNIEEAVREISADQNEIEIPSSGGQMLVRRNTEAEQKRRDLIEKAKCFPYKSEGEEFLICVR